MTLHFILEIGFDIFLALTQTGQFKGPQINTCVEIFAELALRNPLAQIAHGAGDELKIAADLLIAAERIEAFFLNGLQQHRLFICSQFANLIQEKHPAVSAAQQASPFFPCAGKSAFDMAKQRRHCGITAQGGAVHLDERTVKLMARQL